MGLYNDKIMAGCVKRDGKLVCYAYDLSTLPLGANDPSLAKEKCEIIFDGGEPQFKFTGKNGYKLCESLLRDLKNILKGTSDLELSMFSVSKAIEKFNNMEKGE